MAMRSSLARNLLDAGCCCVLSAVCPWESWLYPHPTPKASPRILRTRSAYRRRTSQRHEAKVKCSESGSWSLTSTTSIQNGQRVDCPHTHVTVCLLSVEYPDTLFDDQCVEYPDILYSMISKAVEARARASSVFHELEPQGEQVERFTRSWRCLEVGCETDIQIRYSLGKSCTLATAPCAPMHQRGTQTGVWARCSLYLTVPQRSWWAARQRSWASCSLHPKRSWVGCEIRQVT